MTIEEQQQAIREGLAELMKPHVNYPEEMAETILAFLHDKGAVLDVRDGSGNLMAPLIEPEKPH